MRMICSQSSLLAIAVLTVKLASRVRVYTASLTTKAVPSALAMPFLAAVGVRTPSATSMTG